MNIAVAQPTPLFTVMARVGQLIWHAPHSMQRDLWAIVTTFPLGSKTAWGHTMRHILHPLQRSGLNSSVFSR
jgi:hypothetical protein